MRRHLGLATLAGLMALVLAATAATSNDKVLLKPAAKVGDQGQVTMTMALKGQLQIKSENKVVNLDVKANAEHRFDERVLKLDVDGYPHTVARFYHTAKATLNIHGQPTERTLRSDRRVQVAQKSVEGTVVFSPHGPLYREEHELTADIIDLLAVVGVLPGKEVAIGETWDISLPVAQALAGVDGVIKHDLKGKLDTVTNGVARISVVGSVEGISQAAEVKMGIAGTLLFHVESGQVKQSAWRARVARNQGPVNPASTMETETTIAWEANVPSRELTDALVATLPDVPTAGHLLFAYRDPKGRFSFLHDRNWHVVVQTEQQAVLRCLDHGELVAQLNVAPLKTAAPGRHIEPAEVVRLVQQAPGFTIEKMLQNGVVTAPEGYWVYRVAAAGKAEDVPLVQTTYAVAGPKGEQAVFTFTVEVEQAEKFGGRDVAIIGSVSYPAIIQAGGSR